MNGHPEWDVIKVEYRFAATARRDRVRKRESHFRNLLPGAHGFLLRRTRDYAKNFLLFHDEEIVPVNLDFSAGVLTKENVIAFFEREREKLAFVIGPAFANRNNFTFLWLVFGRIRDDNSAPSRASFFDTPHQNAVVERDKCVSPCVQTPVSLEFVGLEDSYEKPTLARVTHVEAPTADMLD